MYLILKALHIIPAEIFVVVFPFSIRVSLNVSFFLKKNNKKKTR